MLDASPAVPVAAPPSIPIDPVASKLRRDELRHAAIATIGEDTPRGSCTASRRRSRGSGSDRFGYRPRPRLSRRRGGRRVVPRSGRCTTIGSSWTWLRLHDRGSESACRRQPTTIVGHPSVLHSRALRASGRARDVVVPHNAASSRNVRFVRSAMQVRSTRWRSECDHGRPRGWSAASRSTIVESRRGSSAARACRRGIVIVSGVA